MSTRINLITNKPEEPAIKRHHDSIFRGSIFLFGVIVLSLAGVYMYAYMLSRESQVLAQTITDLEAKIASYKEVEEKKSVLTIKTDELQRIYKGRFDYVKAIDDVQKLFAYSLTPDTIELQSTGIVNVAATKTGDIIISQPEALGTNIKELVLTLVVPTSEELKETVDNLRTYLGAGLTSADVIESKKIDEGGYEVKLRLTFGGTTL